MSVKETNNNNLRPFNVIESQIGKSSVNQFFQRVDRLFKLIVLYVQYYLSSLLYTLTPQPDLFDKGELIQNSRNMGKKEDLPLYLKFSQFKPFGDGQCYGASLVMVKNCISANGDMQKASEQFKDGVPILSVAKQHGYDQMFNRVTNHFGKVTSDNNKKWMEDPFFEAIDVKGTEVMRADLNDTARRIHELPIGMYLLEIPTCGSIGEEDITHELFLKKEKDHCYLYDPNVGVGKSSNDDGSKIIKRVFREYCGELSLEKLPETLREKVSYAFRYIFNIVSLKANPNFMEKVERFVHITKVESLSPQKGTNLAA